MRPAHLSVKNSPACCICLISNDQPPTWDPEALEAVEATAEIATVHLPPFTDSHTTLPPQTRADCKSAAHGLYAGPVVNLRDFKGAIATLTTSSLSSLAGQ